MTCSGILSRRTLITAAIGLQLIPVSAFASNAGINAQFNDVLVTACRGLGCIETIGKACQRILGAEASAERLAYLLADDIQSAGGDCSSIGAVHQGLRNTCREDFRVGKIIEVDGWMLSVTEVRAYALSAILS
jgi:hypothetical protein